MIFEYIAQHPGIKAPAIAEGVQKSLRTTQRYLKTLSDSGRIEFRGAPKNGGYYQITNNYSNSPNQAFKSGLPKIYKH